MTESNVDELVLGVVFLRCAEISEVKKIDKTKRIRRE
jgi:hypothetical protein|tara:strand:- start:123673 stop:123783 length:111 start_codon:yes stop_codon:yes gene_type:complete